MPVLVTCKFDENPNKNEGTTDQTMSNMDFLGTQGRVNPK